MSDLIRFDSTTATATIPLADWPEILASLLRQLFTVESETVQIDYSHLSDEEKSDQYHWRSIRQDFVNTLSEVSQQGRLALFVELVNDPRQEVRVSKSVKDPTSLASLQSEGAQNFIAKSVEKLRDTILAESSLKAGWLKSALVGFYRSNLISDTAILSVLRSKISGPADYEEALRIFMPRNENETHILDQLVEAFSDETKAFITSHIGKAKYAAELALLINLFRHSAAVHNDRWSCEQVVMHADTSALGELASHCRKLTADDLRLLLQRLRNCDGSKHAQSLKPAVGEVFSTIARAITPLPTDLVLVGLYLDFVFPEDAAPTPTQIQLYESLKELPTRRYDTDSLWANLGLNARAAWRADLARQAKNETALCEGLFDFACRWLGEDAFVEVEPVLISLIKDDTDLTVLKRLAERGPRLVTLRSRGLIQAKVEANNNATLSADMSYKPLVLTGAATWLGDANVERVIYSQIAGAEAVFCQEYPDHWGEDEEVLTRELIGKAQTAIQEANAKLKCFGLSTKGRYPTLSLNVRQPGKAEEGTKTSLGAPLGADVLFLARIREGGETILERATLVQVKKRRQSATGSFGATIGVDLEQLADLLTQTEHSFYLFLTPASLSHKLWIAPARLVGNLNRLHTSRTSISAQQVHDASISFADFFLRHLLGLWSGDERGEVLNIAKGDSAKGRTPRLIVEVEVQRGGD